MSFIEIRSTKNKQIIDITEEVSRNISVNSGICTLFMAHTTAALTTADLDPGTDLDMLDALDKIIPKLKFRHQHEPEHVPDHILSSIIGPSLFIPVERGHLVLGTWQKIIVVELNGPRPRRIQISSLK